MSIFSEIDMVIVDSIVSGDSSSKIVETLIRDYNINMNFAKNLVENYFNQEQNEYEAEYD